MTDEPIDLDQRRGLGAPDRGTAANWEEAAEKARYVIGLHAASLGAGHTQSDFLD
jgi:hypothetical protein